MKTDVKVLSGFIKKIMLSGESTIEQGLLDFTKNGVVGLLCNPQNTINIRFVLKKSAFKDYQAIGKIGILNFTTLYKMLNRHLEEIEIVVNKNKLTFKDNKCKSEIILPDIDFVKVPEKFPAVDKKEWTETFAINADAIKSFISNLDIVKTDIIKLNTNNSEMILSAGEMDSIENKIENEEIKGGVELKAGKIFIDTLNVLSNNDGMKIHLISNFPIYMIHTTTDYRVEYLISSIKE